jgi:hypothetical protein
VLPSSTVDADEYLSYQGLDKQGYDHRQIHHAKHVYVSGDIHTKVFWSLTKRAIGGVSHAVSAKHLKGYLNKYAWRYNHRADGRALFSTLLRRAASP